MFDFLTKINIVMTFFKLIREHKIIRVLVSVVCVISCLFFYAIYQLKDNSIYLDNKEDSEIREALKAILTKCGDKHAIGLSTISTETNVELYAKFKEIFSCDFLLNPKNCLVDLSSDKFPFAGDYIVDPNTYKFLVEISQKEDVSKIYIPEFDFDEYPTIKALLHKSIHYKDGSAKNLFLTATQNSDRNLIYAIHMISWTQESCADAKYFLNKFRNKLPKTK